MIILPAFLGFAVCLLNAFGADLFCLTTGCDLYSGYSLFGFSFYVFGAIGFGVILLLTISAKRKFLTPILLGGIILAGLILDLLFLGWQILYWPCSSCLVVAFLLGWTALGFYRSYPNLIDRCFKSVLVVWVVLLVPVTIDTAKEVFVSPWAISGPSDATISVYFSPSCPACKTEVTKLLKSPEADRIAFYPIAKNEGDVRLLAELLQEGITQPEDLGKLFESELNGVPAPALSLRLRWHLIQNKMALTRHGVTTIPLILSSTVLKGSRLPWGDLFSSPVSASSIQPTGCGAFDQTAFDQTELPCD